MSCKIALTVLTEIASMARALATMAGLVRIVTSRLAPTRALDMGNAVKAIACVMRDWTGDDCSVFTCPNACSDHGT